MERELHVLSRGIELRETAVQSFGLCSLSLPITQAVTLSKLLNMSMPSLHPCGKKG